MKRIVSIIGIAAILAGGSSAQASFQQATKSSDLAGTACVKETPYKIVKSLKYTCVTSGKKYVWSKGVKLLPYPQNGRIIATTGVAFGGLIQLNPDGKFAVAIQRNTFNDQFYGGEIRSKSDFPSVSKYGVVAFASNRARTGWRIYTVNLDGSGLKQLTTGDGAPRNSGGAIAEDSYPMISPDGKYIAFLSQRAGYARSPELGGRDIFLMNSDGTGLKQILPSEADGRNTGSDVWAIAWSPDSSQIAYRGIRLYLLNGNITRREVLGIMNIDGTNERKYDVSDCGGGQVLDWQQNTILLSYGGAYQGCPEYYSRYYGLSASTGQMVFNIPAEKMGNQAGNGVGAARLSPDGKQVLFTAGPYPGGVAAPTTFNFINTDGTGLTSLNTGGMAPRTWIFWASGNSMLSPTAMVMSPAKITIKRGKTGKLTPILYDQNGQVMSKSGFDWEWGPRAGNFLIDGDGNITTTANTAVGTFDVKMTNASLSALAEVTIIN